jgi:iron(III) transport system substrate-binding protein
MKAMTKVLIGVLLVAVLSMNALAASGELTVYYGAMQDQMAPLLEAFSRRYPDINIKSYRAANEELAATMEMELRARNPQFDVAVMGNGPILTLEGRYNCFDEFTPEGITSVSQDLLDPMGKLIPVGTGFYVIVFNTNEVDPSEAPRSWADLTNAKWTNKIIMADPTSSSSIYTFIWMITQHLSGEPFGWDYFKTLHSMNTSYVASHGTIGEVVAIGERPVGIQVMATAKSSMVKGDPVSIVYPEEGLPSEVNVAVVRKGTKNLENAKLFVEFMLSEEGQMLVADHLGWIPVRTDMTEYRFPDGTLLSELKFLPRDVQWITDERANILENFRSITR